MTPKEYILQELEKLREFHSRKVADKNLADEIFKLLMSKKFRKYSVNPEYLSHICSAIKLNIDKKQPIKLTLVFGGYKLWRLKESPESDWAELFSLIYYTNWLKPICEIYKPGVWFDFYSDDVILEIMDNIPKKDTEVYTQSFKKLLEFIKPYIPKNLNITLNRIGDQYKTYDDFKKELEESINKVKKELDGLPKLSPEQIGLVELNVRLKDGQANDSKWREKVFLIHEGYSRVSKRRPYYRTPDKIFIITKKMKDSIAVGTTKTSIAKFWVGIGALKKKENGFIEYVLSPKQIESEKLIREDISIKELDGKNFHSIKTFS